MFCRNGFALLVLCMPAIGSAQVLNDPTKPPAEINAPAGDVIPAGNALQTILISPNRRAAIIDGQTMELGAKHGDVRLIEVSESGVVLEGSQGRQVLALFPGVEIKKKNVAVLPEVHKVKRAARKEKPVDQSTSEAGKKEKK